jgi:peptide/nickel transport system substrate-binding protein
MVLASSNTTPTTAAATAGPVRGGTLNLAFVADPTRLDPNTLSNLDNEHPLMETLGGLVRSDPNDPLQVIPDLASKWTVSGDRKTYTFTLRQGLKWGDDQPITSADVEYTFYRWLNRPNNLPTPQQGCIRDMVDSTKVVDTLTIDIVLKSPRASFLNCLVMIYQKLSPKRIAEAIDKAGGRDFTVDEFKASASGPYKLVSFTRGSVYTLARNENYYLWKTEGRPYIDTISYYPMRDGGTILAALQAGKIDQSAHFPLLLPTQADDVKKQFSDGIVVSSQAATDRPQLHFNHTKAPFNDIRLRTAANLAIDRKALCDIVLGGKCFNTYPFPEQFDYIYTAADYEKMPGWRQPKDADIAEAKRLVTEATGGKGVNTTMVLPNDPIYSGNAQVLQQQLRKVGINLTLNVQDPVAADALVGQGNFELALRSHGLPYMDPDSVIERFYLATGGRNYAKWSDPKVDAAYQSERGLSSNAARAPFLKQIADTVLKEVPYALLVAPPRIIATRSYVKGLQNVRPSNIIEYRSDYVWIQK